ncbi:MAG: SDR family oxidoreductase [Desulfobacterales bacterium]
MTSSSAAVRGSASNSRAGCSRIRVNAIAPSLTDTPLAQGLLADEGKRTAAADRHPLKCTGTPHEMADIAHFLLSDAASWITGQIFAVDGGMGAVRTFK